MPRFVDQRKRRALGGLAVALIAAGCGTASPSKNASGTTQAATITTGTTPAVAPMPRVRIRSPRASAHTGSTVTVRAVVSGEAGSRLLRYTLDQGPVRSASARFTLHDLAPGRHRLVVMLATDRSVRATRTFVVRTPPPAPVPAPAPATTTQPPAPVPAPAPATTTQPPAPAPQPTTTTSTPTPTTGSGIPQNNGGDGDSDNNGGPSDGDGNF